MASESQSVLVINDCDDEITKILVAGYLRELHLSQQFMIPPQIIRFCLVYFYEPEHFEIHGEAIELSKNKTLATHTNKYQCAEFASVYGYLEINNVYLNAVYQWKFKVINNCKFNTAIGMCSSTTITDGFYTDSDAEFYAFGYGAKLNKRGWSEKKYPGLSHGDIVSMECDINAQTVSFKVNEDSRVAVFEGVDYSTSYHIGVVMYNPKDAVELLSIKRWKAAS